MPPAELKYERIIIGIDPGTNIMGYGILGVNGRRAAMIAMGIIKLNAFESHYTRLRRIHERVTSLIDQYLPDEMAIEAPFFGKNVQSMLKLGRAQGAAMVAALLRDIPITEYEPRKIKMAITGNGGASKEQVQTLVASILAIPREQLLPQLDATDALAAALCHHYETSSPLSPHALHPATAPTRGAVTPYANSAPADRIKALTSKSSSKSDSWATFLAKNPTRIKR